jgi:hypothetical protein
MEVDDMRPTILKKDVQKLLGKNIYAIKKDGTAVSGKLVRISGNRLIVAPSKGKARVSALIPLVLFDLLAVGTAPYAGYGYGYGYPGYGYGYGSPFFF